MGRLAVPVRGPSPTRRARGGRETLRILLLLTFALAGLDRLFHDDATSAERTGPVKIGALTEAWGPTAAMVGLRDGLIAHGYREEEHFVIGVRFTQGDAGMLSSAAQELVSAGSDIIFVSGTGAAKAAQRATTRVPVVFAEAVGDPVEAGLVQSFARPGGNITGISDLDLELAPKRLEILKEMLPGLKRVLIPYDPAEMHGAAAVRLYRDAARRLGIELEERPVRTPEEARATLANVRRSEVHALVAPVVTLNIAGLILDATSQRQMPSMFSAAFWPERGGLVSYGPDFYQSGRQAARLVDKIIRGESPARIPVETNPRIELTINVKVAKVLGLQIPPAVLQRADRLIE